MKKTTQALREKPKVKGRKKEGDDLVDQSASLKRRNEFNSTKRFVELPAPPVIPSSPGITESSDIDTSSKAQNPNFRPMKRSTCGNSKRRYFKWMSSASRLQLLNGSLKSIEGKSDLGDHTPNEVNDAMQHLSADILSLDMNQQSTRSLALSQALSQPMSFRSLALSQQQSLKSLALSAGQHSMRSLALSTDGSITLGTIDDNENDVKEQLLKLASNNSNDNKCMSKGTLNELDDDVENIDFRQGMFKAQDVEINKSFSKMNLSEVITIPV
jgi:hypothetical protein